MTKMQIIRTYYFDFTNTDEFKDFDQRIDVLMEQDRITTGARYYIHDFYKWYGARMLSDITSKAVQSKNYNRYIKRVSLWDYTYYMNDIIKSFEEMKAFVIEQENLPFEETQKQVLIAKGELETE